MALQTFCASSRLKYAVRSNIFSGAVWKNSLLAVTRPSETIYSEHCDSITTVKFYHTSFTVSAGHSKWSNIRHVKAAQDQKKSSIALELTRRVQQCLVHYPETDPKLNTELAALIKRARTNNISNDTIQKTIDRVVKLRDVSSITAFAGRGPANTGIVIECTSLKPHHTKTLLQGIVKKFGFSLHVSGDDLFVHKGKVEASLPEEEFPSAQADPENFNIDKFVDVAIEVGAEDVTLEPGEEGPILQFLCGPQDLTKVQKALGEAGLAVITGETTYLPTHVVPVAEEFLEAFGKLEEKLDLFPDVVKYYHNMEPEQSS